MLMPSGSKSMSAYIGGENFSPVRLGLRERRLRKARVERSG